MHGAASASRFAFPTPWHPTIDTSCISEKVHGIPHHDFQPDVPQNPVGYERIAQDLRSALRDDDVEMEDTSDWPASWGESDDGQASRSGEGTPFAQSSTLGLGAQSFVSSENLKSRTLYIALDTNIFISHLKTVQAIHERLSLATEGHQTSRKVSKQSQRQRIKLLVPNIVVHGEHSAVGLSVSSH